MFSKIIKLFKLLDNKEIKYQNDQLLRLVKVEYKKDWQYAYLMLSKGKVPYSENINI